MTQSWDARAANPNDHLWDRGQLGLFAILDWLVLLDTLAAFPGDISLIA